MFLTYVANVRKWKRPAPSGGEDWCEFNYRNKLRNPKGLSNDGRDHLEARYA